MGEDVRKIGVARFDQANPIQTARDEYAGDNDYQLDSIKIISASFNEFNLSLSGPEGNTKPLPIS